MQQKLCRLISRFWLARTRKQLLTITSIGVARAETSLAMSDDGGRAAQSPTICLDKTPQNAENARQTEAFRITTIIQFHNANHSDYCTFDSAYLRLDGAEIVDGTRACTRKSCGFGIDPNNGVGARIFEQAYFETANGYNPQLLTNGCPPKMNGVGGSKEPLRIIPPG